jgi:hypothetical protein
MTLITRIAELVANESIESVASVYGIRDIGVIRDENRLRESWLTRRAELLFIADGADYADIGTRRLLASCRGSRSFVASESIESDASVCGIRDIGVIRDENTLRESWLTRRAELFFIADGADYADTAPRRLLASWRRIAELVADESTNSGGPARVVSAISASSAMRQDRESWLGRLFQVRADQNKGRLGDAAIV